MISREIIDLIVGKATIKVLKNPTMNDVKRLIRRSNEHARYIENKETGDYYFWKGYDATHNEVANRLSSNPIWTQSWNRGGVMREGDNIITTLGNWNTRKSS